MFCIYENGIAAPFRGTLKDDTGTYGAAWLQKAIPDGRAPANIYFFEDRTKIGIDEFHNPATPIDAPPDANFMVVRTSTPVLKNIDAIKARKSAQVTQRRKMVSEGGVYWVDGADTYVVDTKDSSQDKLVRATVHGNESGNANRKWTLVQETGTSSDIWTVVRPTLTMPKFKQMAVAVGDHIDACYDAEEAHLTAIAALTTAQDVYDHNIEADIVGSEWPTNPVHPDNRTV